MATVSYCSGQLKLATALEFFQYLFSDSFGVILSCCGKILGSQTFIILIYGSGNVQIFMCIYAVYNAP